MTTENATITAVIFAGVVFPDALIGASLGALFFLTMPNEFSRLINGAYAFLSGFIGYAVGVAVLPDYRMLAAFCGAALGVLLLLGVAKAIKYDKWESVITKMLEIIRGLK